MLGSEESPDFGVGFNFGLCFPDKSPEMHLTQRGSTLDPRKCAMEGPEPHRDRHSKTKSASCRGSSHDVPHHRHRRHHHAHPHHKHSKHPSLSQREPLVTLNDLRELFAFYLQHNDTWTTRRSPYSHPLMQKAQSKVHQLFSLDYDTSTIPNPDGELCGTYPLSIILIEQLKQRARMSKKKEERSQAGAVEREEDKQTGNNANVLAGLFRKSKFSRVRGRFVVPVMWVRGRNVCRSATLSHEAEVIFHTLNEKTKAFWYGHQEQPQPEGPPVAAPRSPSSASWDGPRTSEQRTNHAGHSVASPSVTSMQSPSVAAGSTRETLTRTPTSASRTPPPTLNTSIEEDLVSPLAKQRQADIQLLHSLHVTTIADLMVETRKVKYGLTVTSSEKADSLHRYTNAGLELVAVPYPGVEFFRKFKGEERWCARGLKFDWDQVMCNAELNVPRGLTSPDAVERRESTPIRWEEYKTWDLVSLTKNYLHVLLSILAHPNRQGLLIHCISGWDRTPLFISLLRLSLWADSEAHASLFPIEILYLTIAYDWMLFSHLLADRRSRGEDIFTFCFYFLAFIMGEEFRLAKASIGGRLRKRKMSGTRRRRPKTKLDASATSPLHPLSSSPCRTGTSNFVDTTVLHSGNNTQADHAHSFSSAAAAHTPGVSSSWQWISLLQGTNAVDEQEVWEPESPDKRRRTEGWQQYANFTGWTRASSSSSSSVAAAAAQGNRATNRRRSQYLERHHHHGLHGRRDNDHDNHDNEHPPLPQQQIRQTTLIPNPKTLHISTCDCCRFDSPLFLHSSPCMSPSCPTSSSASSSSSSQRPSARLPRTRDTLTRLQISPSRSHAKLVESLSALCLEEDGELGPGPCVPPRATSSAVRHSGHHCRRSMVQEDQLSLGVHSEDEGREANGVENDDGICNTSDEDGRGRDGVTTTRLRKLWNVHQLFVRIRREVDVKGQTKESSFRYGPREAPIEPTTGTPLVGSDLGRGHIVSGITAGLHSVHENAGSQGSLVIPPILDLPNPGEDDYHHHIHAVSPRHHCRHRARSSSEDLSMGSSDSNRLASYYQNHRNGSSYCSGDEDGSPSLGAGFIPRCRSDEASREHRKGLASIVMGYDYDDNSLGVNETVDEDDVDVCSVSAGVPRLHEETAGRHAIRGVPKNQCNARSSMRKGHETSATCKVGGGEVRMMTPQELQSSPYPAASPPYAMPIPVAVPTSHVHGSTRTTGSAIPPSRPHPTQFPSRSGVLGVLSDVQRGRRPPESPPACATPTAATTASAFPSRSSPSSPSSSTCTSHSHETESLTDDVNPLSLMMLEPMSHSAASIGSPPSLTNHHNNIHCNAMATCGAPDQHSKLEDCYIPRRIRSGFHSADSPCSSASSGRGTGCAGNIVGMMVTCGGNNASASMVVEELEGDEVLLLRPSVREVKSAGNGAVANGNTLAGTSATASAAADALSSPGAPSTAAPPSPSQTPPTPSPHVPRSAPPSVGGSAAVKFWDWVPTIFA